MTARLIMTTHVAEVERDTDTVSIFTLRHPRRPELPPATPGAHVDIHLPDGRIRQYSLCGDLSDRSVYRVAIKREDQGRGASCWLHANLGIGSTVNVSAPRNNFPIKDAAKRHVLIAAGIGITPLAAMARHLSATKRDFVVHYCARSEVEAPLLRTLLPVCGPERMRTYFSAVGQRLDVQAALETEVAIRTHVYCCGPRRLQEGVKQATAGWPASHIHFEAFVAMADENFKPEPFDIKLASTGETLRVPADRSALEVLREHGLALLSSCELGLCGSCVCGYRDGIVIHRDSVLDANARRDRILPCVSRARVKVTLDL